MPPQSHSTQIRFNEADLTIICKTEWTCTNREISDVTRIPLGEDVRHKLPDLKALSQSLSLHTRSTQHMHINMNSTTPFSTGRIYTYAPLSQCTIREVYISHPIPSNPSLCPLLLLLNKRNQTQRNSKKTPRNEWYDMPTTNQPTNRQNKKICPKIVSSQRSALLCSAPHQIGRIQHTQARALHPCN